MNNYLWKQIELVNPKTICLLGSVAVQELLRKRSVTAVRGKIYEKMNRLFFCTIHPAAALYDASVKPIFFEDIKELKNVAENPERFLKKPAPSATLDEFMK